MLRVAYGYTPTTKEIHPMKFIRTTLAVAVAVTLSLATVGEANASECANPTLAPSSENATVVTVKDTEVGTEAFERLVEYANGGHRTLGLAIAEAHDWFGVCEYVGVGIGHGSGGNGFRPSVTLALWRDGVNATLARSVVYDLIDASDNPVVTNGDCRISCDGTIDGELPTTTTTTTVAPTTTTTVAVEEVSAPVADSAPVSEPTVSEPVAEEVPAPTTTTTTTTVPVVESAGALVSSAPTVAVATKSVVTKRVVTKRVVKKPITKKPVAKK